MFIYGFGGSRVGESPPSTQSSARQCCEGRMIWQCRIRSHVEHAPKRISSNKSVSTGYVNCFFIATPSFAFCNVNSFKTYIRYHGRRILSLLLSASNLTDKAYQSHLSRLKYAPVNEATGRMGVFNMGRNFTFKVEVPIGIFNGK